MMCAWKELLAILPLRLRAEVDRQGRESLQELRLRINAPAELVLGGKVNWLSGNVTQDELNFVVNTASRYSPWAASTTAQGFLTAPGGHRIGICGEAVCKDGNITGMCHISYLCIRVARDFPDLLKSLQRLEGSVLILGAPGWGKTTLLRCLIRQVAQEEAVSVVDERGELFPQGFLRGRRMDILTGCPKPAGIEMMLRTMGPACIAVDEITAAADCQALIQAANCGVRLLATAHAGSSRDYCQRGVYRELVHQKIFDTLIVLHKDKSYHMERMTL